MKTGGGIGRRLVDERENRRQRDRGRRTAEGDRRLAERARIWRRELRPVRCVAEGSRKRKFEGTQSQMGGKWREEVGGQRRGAGIWRREAGDVAQGAPQRALCDVWRREVWS